MSNITFSLFGTPINIVIILFSYCMFKALKSQIIEYIIL